MNIVLLGPQGSGKGTQAILLSQQFGLCMVSVGELLRKETGKNTERGREVGKTLAAGHLVPTNLTIEILKEFLQQNPCEGGIILDGFPRTLDQAEALDGIRSVDVVIELKLADTECVNRLSARTQCANDHIYGLNRQPEKKGVCDVDGLKLAVRADDKPAAIRERLKIYHDETEPLLEFYRPRKNVYTVDASRSQQQVFRSISRIIKELPHDLSCV